MMKINCFTNTKGGVGKSMFCVQYAYWLAMKGYKVLVIDSDTQANATFHLGTNPYQEIWTFYDLIQRKTTILDTILKPRKNIDLIPVTTEDSIDIKYNTDNLNYIFDELKNNFNYDYILVDTKPTKDFLNEYLWHVSDTLSIPFACDLPSYKAMKRIFDYCDDQDFIKKNYNILTNFHNKNKNVKDAMEYLGKHYTGFFYEPIPNSVFFKESYEAQNSIFNLKTYRKKMHTEIIKKLDNLFNWMLVNEHL